jgi:hypothetical protein
MVRPPCAGNAVSQIEIKRGAVLRLRAEVTNADGSAMVDLEEDWVTSQVRDAADALIGSLAWTLAAPATLEVTADTSAWPVGTHRLDIRIARPDGTAYSDTLSLRVDAAVTQ